MSYAAVGIGAGIGLSRFVLKKFQEGSSDRPQTKRQNSQPVQQQTPQPQAASPQPPQT